jgi:hypothetical protein
VQRGQGHPSLRSCQFSYPLPFRGQVCKAQSPLPCCPSTVLSSWRPPSLDRVPVSPVPRRHQYYEGATTSRPRMPGHLFGSLPGPTRFPRGSCSLMQRSRAGGGPASGQDPCSTGDPYYPATRRVDVGGSSQVPRRPFLRLCPIPRPRPNQRSLANDGPASAALALPRAKASA